jgi:hypothetical protein
VLQLNTLNLDFNYDHYNALWIYRMDLFDDDTRKKDRVVDMNVIDSLVHLLRLAYISSIGSPLDQYYILSNYFQNGKGVNGLE